MAVLVCYVFFMLDIGIVEFWLTILRLTAQ